MPENLRDTLVFLRELRVNNNRSWFEANRRRYEPARAHFEGFVAELIAGFGDVEDLGSVTVKECVYRINRDIRFSPDKSPYKSTMSAVIGREGRKSTGRSYYVQIAPDGESLLAGGLYQPSTQELDRMRRSIADDSTAFRKIVNKRDFKQFFGELDGERLKTAPQGYRKDHPDIDLLRLKQFLAEHSFSNEEVLADDLAAQIIAMCEAMKPFLTYIQTALEGE